MNWVTTASIVLQLIPSLIQAVKAIEEAIPGQGQGEAKLAAIRGIMESIHEQASFVWPALEKAVGSLVKLFNATGVFRK